MISADLLRAQESDSILPMRLASIALVFSALASAQTAQNPSTGTLSDAWRQRLKDLKLIGPEHITIQQMTVGSKPKGCAIPLLNALPANNNVDYKIHTVKPPANVEHSNAVAPQIGLPACEPGLFTLKPPDSEKK